MNWLWSLTWPGLGVVAWFYMLTRIRKLDRDALKALGLCLFAGPIALYVALVDME